jgi:hypothetical protein
MARKMTDEEKFLARERRDIAANLDQASIFLYFQWHIIRKIYLPTNSKNSMSYVLAWERNYVERKGRIDRCGLGGRFSTRWAPGGDHLRNPVLAPGDVRLALTTAMSGFLCLQAVRLEETPSTVTPAQPD